VASGATGDIEGVTAGVGISGGGTSGTVTVTNSMATAIDAKGDLVPGTGADTFSRLAVGANDTVLTADSTAATGMKWAAPAAGGGMTLISTTTLSGTSTTLSSIPQTYTSLYLIIKGVTGNTGNQRIRCWPNGVTTLSDNTGVNGGTVMNQQNGVIRLSENQTTNTDANNSFALTFNDYTSSTSYKPYNWYGFYVDSIGNNYSIISGGAFRSNTAITSLVIDYTGNTFAGGTVLLYGVK
jgi:hypothetical protein